jgi:O-antigen/teichoic acid export membrane protein
VTTELARASREAGVYAYSRVLSSLLVLLVGVIGTRLYAKPELAFVIAVVLLHETAMAIGSLGLADAVYFFIGRDPGSARWIVRQTSLLLLLFAIPAIAGMVIAGRAMSGPELDLVPSLPWLALVLLIELPTQPAVNQMIASGRARLASGLFVGFVILRLIALLLPGVVGLPVTWAPIMMAATGLFRLAVHVVIVRGVFPLAPGEDRRAWATVGRLREILWFALPAGAAMIAGKINPQIDKFAANLFLGTSAFADYGVAAFELPLVTLVPYAIAAVMQPRYVRLFMAGDVATLRATWFAIVGKTALLVVPLSILAIVVAGDLVRVVFQPQYADAALPFRILTIVVLHRVAAYGSMLQSINQPRAVMIASVLVVTTNLVLTWPMTALFGYPGPALATLLAAVPAFFFVLGRIGAVLGGGLRGALPWGVYGRLLLLGGLIGVAVTLGLDAVPDLRPGIRLAGASAVYLTLFTAIGRRVGLIGPDDLRYLRQWLTLQMLRKEPGHSTPRPASSKSDVVE